MILLAELEEFVADLRPHGALIGDATVPAWNGYLVTVACPCGWCLSGGSRRKRPSWIYCDLLRVAGLN
jgi:hypothetical protein